MSSTTNVKLNMTPHTFKNINDLLIIFIKHNIFNIFNSLFNNTNNIIYISTKLKNILIIYRSQVHL